MMAVRPCYSSDVSFADFLAQVQDEQQREENERLIAETMEKAKDYGILNR